MGRKNNTLIENREVVMNEQTGEVIEERRYQSFYVEKEPDYVKTYIRTVQSFTNTEGISYNFIRCLCDYITYANDEKTQTMVILNQAVKNQMMEKLNLKLDMINKYIKKCVDGGLLFKTEYRATYIVNPFLIARGEWKYIKSLRTEFSYIDGKWTYEKKLNYTE